MSADTLRIRNAGGRALRRLYLWTSANASDVETSPYLTGSATEGVLVTTLDGSSQQMPLAGVAPGGDRVSLSWTAGAEGKPGINADFVSATESVNTVTNRHFEILGTNASSDDVTYNAEGGITFTTDGADGDGVIMLPHLDANQSPWTTWTWGTDKSVVYECLIETGAAITNSIVWAGLKLTNTDVVATDDDQAFFRYENGVSSGVWVAVTSIGGTDTSTVSTVTVAVSTKYRLRIAIDSSRIARLYINGALIVTTAALTDTVDLIPYIAVEADGAAEAKTLTVYGAAISRAAG